MTGSNKMFLIGAALAVLGGALAAHAGGFMLVAVCMILSATGIGLAMALEIARPGAFEGGRFQQPVPVRAKSRRPCQ